MIYFAGPDNTCYNEIMGTKSLVTEFASPKEFFEQIAGRSEIQLLSNEQIREFYADKKILITGAGGTIGSAVARRLNEANIQQTFYLDRDESALHALALSLSDTAASHSDKCLVADVRDVTALESIFLEIKPDLIIHTAALKHLVVLERFPREGVLTNIFGTLNVVEAAERVGIGQILNVSTDKAALPTSVLGKTKLIAEHITQDKSSSNMVTSSVRFGNVFASRGSVIETFVHQIQNNLLVTITHPDVTRFFMSHNEAANLILATCTMRSNAVFVQEMGARIKILDVVQRLGEALQMEPQLSFVGLHNGEKLHEDLYEKDFTATDIPSIVQLPFSGNVFTPEELRGIQLPQSNEEALILISKLINQIEVRSK